MSAFFHITCKTHLHAGSGDSNFGVIDKLVQRDPTDNLPCIYASSLKGALREYFDEVIDTSKKISEDIFGKDDKGKVIFHQAYILSLPIRSNQFPYFNVTAPMAIDALLDNAELLGISLALEKDLKKIIGLSEKDKIIIGENNENLKIEDFEGDEIVPIKITEDLQKALANLLGNRIAIVDDATFKELSSDYSLPIIARNNLENGQSKNLWYEQIIPRETRFFFATTDLVGKDANQFHNQFNDKKLLQIGANATIGYGQCLISKI
jgi:CRISPR-associated protein Cmr4